MNKFPLNQYVIPAPGYRVILQTLPGVPYPGPDGLYFNGRRMDPFALDVPPHIWLRLWELSVGPLGWRDRIWFAWRCLFPEKAR